MSLHVYKNKKNKYNYAISGLHNTVNSCLFPDIFQSFELASQAQSAGRKYVKFANTILKFAQSEDSSGIETGGESSESGDFVNENDGDSENSTQFGGIILDHYFGMLESVNDRYNGIRGDPEARKDIYEELKLITGNLLQIRSSLEEEKEIAQIKKILAHYSRFAKEKFQDLLNEDLKKKKSSFEKFKIVTSGKIENFSYEDIKDDLLEDLAKEACSAIQDLRKDAVYILDKDNKRITIASCENQIKYLSISLNDKYNIKKIISLDPFCKNNDFSFYQNYLKPINSKFNNMVLAGNNIHSIDLPDLPNKNKNIGIISEDNEVSLGFNCNKKTWNCALNKITAAIQPTKFKEEDFVNAKLIKCIDPELDTIYEKTGSLIQVIPTGDHIELDVDFGHQVIRLSENQIKIIDEI